MNIILIILFIAILLIPLWVLFGSGGEKEASQQLPPSEDTAFRRRDSDKKLEEEFPDDDTRKRRKDDRRRPSDKPTDELLPIEQDFSLPFSPGDIIPENSPFDIYRRTLKNAEVYMQKGDFATARSIYEGVMDRIGDNDIRNRLEENLDYLNNYHQILSKRNETRKQMQTSLKPQEIRLTVEGADNLAERLQIGLKPEKPPIDVNELVTKLSEKISDLVPDHNALAQQSAQKYSEELQQLKNQLNDVSAIKDKLQTLNEQQMKRDREELIRLKQELAHIQEAAEKQHADSVPQTITPVTEEELSKREAVIKEDIRRREDENRILRERLELMQHELAGIKSDKDTVSADNAHADTSDAQREEHDARMREMAQLKEELSSLKQEVQRQAESERAPMRELAEAMRDNMEALAPLMKDAAAHQEAAALPSADAAALNDIAGAMKESMETLAPILKDQAKKAEEELLAKKKEDEKKDDFQLMDEYINGPKFDEPTDDDVMEKILNDAMREQKKKDDAEKKKHGADAKKEEPLKEDAAAPADDRKSEKKKEPEEDIKNDFELVSDYMRGPEEGMPTDEEVMEKILKDTMRGKEFAGPQGRYEGSGSPKDRGKDFSQPQRRKKELPILRVSYNFSRLPDEFTLSTDKNYLEFSFYKFKPLLEKAADLVKRRKVKDAINYYKVVMDQDIPIEFKEMLGQNIRDLNEYLTKYYTTE